MLLHALKYYMNHLVIIVPTLIVGPAACVHGVGAMEEPKSLSFPCLIKCGFLSVAMSYSSGLQRCQIQRYRLEDRIIHNIVKLFRYKLNSSRDCEEVDVKSPSHQAEISPAVAQMHPYLPNGSALCAL